MEEISQGQYRIPIERYDGAKVNMEIKQKHLNNKKRKVKTWTQEEDYMLLDLYNQYPKKWSTIASLMNDRNQNQCLHRYRRINQEGDHRKIWSSQEDETVKKLMKKVGKNWKVLSQMLGTKTGKQIRQRFINKLDPKIKKEEWTDEQDHKIIILYSQIGRKWSEISKHLPGRPQNKVKNRFYSFIKKNYDIRYRPLEQKCQQNKQTWQEKVVNVEIQPKNSMGFLKQISNLCKSSNNELMKFQPRQIYNLPSINHFQDEIKAQYFSQNQQNVYNRSYFSMVKVEQDWKYENKDVFCQHEEFKNEFFFLSQS